jgi:hypothetical protein
MPKATASGVWDWNLMLLRAALVMRTVWTSKVLG